MFFAVAESWDDFIQFVMNFQWFQPPIHSAFMQRRYLLVITLQMWFLEPILNQNELSLPLESLKKQFPL